MKGREREGSKTGEITRFPVKRNPFLKRSSKMDGKVIKARSSSYDNAAFIPKRSPSLVSLGHALDENYREKRWRA